MNDWRRTKCPDCGRDRVVPISLGVCIDCVESSCALVLYTGHGLWYSDLTAMERKHDGDRQG